MKKKDEAGVEHWLGGLGLNRFHYAVMLLAGLVELFSGYNSQIIAYTMPQIMPEWKLNPVLGGTLSAYTFVGFMVGSLGLGTIADRIGRKRTLMLSVALFAGFGGLAGLAPSFWPFVLLRFLSGIGMGAALPVAIALVSEYAPARVRARAVTVMTCGFNLGWAVAGLGGILIIPAWGWRAALLAGALPLLMVPVLWWWLPESVHFLAARGRHGEAVRELRRLEKAAGLPARDWRAEHFSGGEKGAGRVREILGEGLAATTLLLWIMYLLIFLVIYGVTMWLPTFLLRSGFSLAGGYGLGIFQSLCTAAGGIASGYLMDRWGRKPVLAGYYLVGAAALCLLAASSSFWTLAVATAATGVFLVSVPMLQHVVAGETYPTTVRSTGVGWALTVGRLGSILGPVLVGGLQMAGLGLRADFLLLALPCFLCGALTLLPVFRTVGRPERVSVSA
ncbi:MAG: MFS transporter [Moorellales bacterium]